MAHKISRKEDLLQRLQLEGKIEIKNQPEDQQVVIEMNERLKEIRKDFQTKERESQLSSSRVILT